MSTPSVLVIDDEDAVREAVAEDLKREGYDLVFAGNGQDGLSRIQERTPTVIILDLRMPVMDGLEFLSKIRLKPTDPYSVIVLTGHGNADAVKECYEAGVTVFLKKPFNLYEVRGVVRNAIAMKQLTNHLDDLVKNQTTQLEQRVREVTALNRFFQQQLTQQVQVVSEYREVFSDLQRLARQVEILGQLTPAEPIPVLPVNQGEDPPSQDAPAVGQD
ncbi:MAG: response regulator [Chloroflexi bacterium]|nr:response regulator [Chloroflexota bacterium]